MAQAISQAEFDQTLDDAKHPVLVDFWASWCGPCRALSPIIDEIADEMSSKLDVYKCNVDEEPELASRFGIQSIPTLILFKNGEQAHKIVGSMPKADLVADLAAHL